MREGKSEIRNHEKEPIARDCTYLNELRKSFVEIREISVFLFRKLSTHSPLDGGSKNEFDQLKARLLLEIGIFPIKFL